MNMPNIKHPNNCHWDDKQNEHRKMNSCLYLYLGTIKKCGPTKSRTWNQYDNNVKFAWELEKK